MGASNKLEGTGVWGFIKVERGSDVNNNQVEEKPKPKPGPKDPFPGVKRVSRNDGK